jgi:hypothetical protein
MVRIWHMAMQFCSHTAWSIFKVFSSVSALYWLSLCETELCSEAGSLVAGETHRLLWNQMCLFL